MDSTIEERDVTVAQLKGGIQLTGGHEVHIIVSDWRGQVVADPAPELAPSTPVAAPAPAPPAEGQPGPILASAAAELPPGIDLRVDRRRVLPGEQITLSWTVIGTVQELSLAPAGIGTVADSAVDPTRLDPGETVGSLTLTLQDPDVLSLPRRTVTFTLTAYANGQRLDSAPVAVEVALPRFEYTLRSLPLTRAKLEPWMSQPLSPALDGTYRDADAVRCIRLALFFAGYDVTAGSAYDGALVTAVQAFKSAQRSDPAARRRMEALNCKPAHLADDGDFDRLTAALLDQWLLDKVELPERYRYQPVKVKEESFSTNPTSENALPGRCIAILDYWAEKDGAGRRRVKYGDGYPACLAFGGQWDRASGAANAFQSTADCTHATLAAFFWATRGAAGNHDFILDRGEYVYITQWMAAPRKDYGDGCVGVLKSLRLGDAIALSAAETKAIADAVDAEVAAGKLQASGKDAQIANRKLRKLVNKLQPGDCVQGWAGTTGDDGHAFFVTDVTRDASGDVTQYTVLTSNGRYVGGTPTGEGVSRVTVSWDAYKDPRIGRFYRIEGE